MRGFEHRYTSTRSPGHTSFLEDDRNSARGPRTESFTITRERFECTTDLLWGDERRDVRGDRRRVHFSMTAGCCRSLSTAVSTECRAINAMAFLRHRREKRRERRGRLGVARSRFLSTRAYICLVRQGFLDTWTYQTLGDRSGEWLSSRCIQRSHVKPRRRPQQSTTTATTTTTEGRR